MYQHHDPEDRVAILQMNSELQHAHLELLSAHCATHQLRLHYSSEDLARFGRRDVLRKSAAAACALNEFYSAIEKSFAESRPVPDPSMQVTREQMTQAAEWLASYLRAQREFYLAPALPLSSFQKVDLAPYFSHTLLERVRAVELQGARVAPPGFFAKVRSLGFDPPEMSHMDSLTFLDVIVFNERLTERALFHGLVHAVQIQVLGLERYCELWIGSFVKTRAHFTVPLEVHAFSLASKFIRPTQPAFSVENEVLLWATDERY